MGGGSDQPETSPFEKQLSRMAMGLYNQTQPLRTGLLGQYKSILSGNYNPETSSQYGPMFATGKESLESQYGNARENVMGSVPRGGELTSALTSLEGARAQDVGMLPMQISSQIMQDLENKLYGTAWNAPGQAMGGMGSAAGTYGNRLAAWEQAQGTQTAGLGQGIGTLLGLAATRVIPSAGMK